MNCFNRSCLIYPTGIDETSEYISVRLVNLSNEEVYASYSIAIKNQYGKRDFIWKDPEQILVFSSSEHSDNEWGS